MKIQTIHKRLKGDPEDRAKQIDEALSEQLSRGWTLLSTALGNNVVYLTFSLPDDAPSPASKPDDAKSGDDKAGAESGDEAK